MEQEPQGLRVICGVPQGTTLGLMEIQIPSEFAKTAIEFLFDRLIITRRYKTMNHDLIPVFSMLSKVKNLTLLFKKYF